MATVNVVLKKNKKYTDGKQPLYIRITKGNSSKYISLGFRLNPKDWLKEKQKVRKGVENSSRINNFIAQKAAEAHDLAMKMETESSNSKPNSIKNTLLGLDKRSFNSFVSESLVSLKNTEKFDSHHSLVYTMNKLNEFTGNKILEFEDITPKFLTKFQKFCIEEQGLKLNTFANFAIIIKKIFNDAIREGYAKQSDFPFKIFKVKREQPDIEFLTDDELFKLIDYSKKLEGKKRDYLNLYIFACYGGGIRFSNLCLLKWSNFDGTHLLFNVLKSKSQRSIKLPNRALDIIKEYQSETLTSEDFIFPFLRGFENESEYKIYNKKIGINKAVNRCIQEVAKELQINKHIHFHTSRHTFATRALRKGMRIEYVSKLLGHASIKTTQIYAKVVNSELDKAMDILND